MMACTVQIGVDQRTLRARLDAANGAYLDAQVGSGRRFRRPAPHFLQIVEGTHFRAEEMHDHIAGIYQHPVGRLQAFDLGRAISCFLDGAQHMVGNRADMAVGPPAGDQDEIGDG